jgi:hypothetical protein
MNITRLETAGLSVGDYFFNLMFEECTSLNNDAPDAQTFHIPNLTSTVGFCNQMFIGTIFAPPNTPNRGSDYLINTAFN